MNRILAFAFMTTGAVVAFADSPTHSFITADSSKKRIAVIGEKGETLWETQIGPLHDLHVLKNGNVLFQRNWTQIVEVNPQNNETVWSYDAKKSPGNEGRKVEVHAFQRLANGNTMVVESGTSRILEVNADGKVTHTVALRVQTPHPHTDTRIVRKLPSGNYLVCHEADGLVREYTTEGETAWEYKIPLFGKTAAKGHGLEAFGNKCFSAIRLANGNTLIATGNGHSVIEVTEEKKIAWQLHQNDLLNIQLAWVTTLQELPNGNIVIGNCHAGSNNPQIIEVNREKEVVWTFHDFERFGNATTNTQIISTNGNYFIAEAGVSR